MTCPCVFGQWNQFHLPPQSMPSFPRAGTRSARFTADSSRAGAGLGREKEEGSGQGAPLHPWDTGSPFLGVCRLLGPAERCSRHGREGQIRPLEFPPRDANIPEFCRIRGRLPTLAMGIISGTWSLRKGERMRRGQLPEAGPRAEWPSARTSSQRGPKDRGLGAHPASRVLLLQRSGTRNTPHPKTHRAWGIRGRVSGWLC